MRKAIIAILMLAILIIAVVVIVPKDKRVNNRYDGSSSISNYQECLDKGYPIQESYPSVCHIPGGQSFSNPEEVAPPSSQTKEEVIQEAKQYKPEGICTQALVPAVHKATGAKYTFSSGCLAPGWEADY